MVLTPSIDIELDLKADSNVKVWAEFNVRAESKAGEEMKNNIVKIMITLQFYFQPNVILAGTDILIQCREEISTCLVEAIVSEANFSLEAGTY